jgi:hypothetical protein
MLSLTTCCHIHSHPTTTKCCTEQTVRCLRAEWVSPLCIRIEPRGNRKDCAIQQTLWCLCHSTDTVMSVPGALIMLEVVDKKQHKTTWDIIVNYFTQCNWMQTGGPRFVSRQEQEFLSFPPRSYWLYDSSSLLTNGYRGFSSRVRRPKGEAKH